MVGVTFVGHAHARADDGAELKQIIEKAITAQGGREKLSKYKAFTMKMKGKANAQGMALDFTMDLQVQEPDKSKFTMDVSIMGQTFKIVQVINGDKGWKRNPGATDTEDMSKEELAEQREQTYARNVENLLDLREKKFKLSPLGESKVGDSEVVGIKVTSEGHRDVSLYFDKKNHLLLKTETNAKDPMTGDKEFAQESIYSDYKEANGVKYAAKMIIKRDGAEFMTGEMTEWTPSEKLEDGVFTKP
jgi:hypothetical protein